MSKKAIYKIKFGKRYKKDFMMNISVILTFE